ncbi:MAG: tetratricopeptide repeat protein [Candidatus Omnitrophica bacterium]|nr:tetratricopeptide repeat protein [Candidatus Omnitrophota bacterium]
MKKICLLLFILLVRPLVSYSMDWKSLHNKADEISLPQAQEAVLENNGLLEDRYILGLVYLDLHRDQDAYNLFSALLNENPDMVGLKWGQGESLRRLHELKNAESLLNEALKQDPQFAPALISMAYIRYFKMDFKGAVQLASKVIQQGLVKVDLSNYARAYAMYAGSKGMLAHYGGIFSKAIDGLAVKTNLDKAQKLQPDSPAVLFGLGSYYLLAPVIAGGNKSKAEEYLNKALAADPLFADVYVRLAQLAKIKGEKGKYEYYMNKALEIDPGNELALDTKSGRCKFICTGGEE